MIPTKNRALLALMDEYRRACKDYFTLLSRLSVADFTLVRDTNTNDHDCRSIQSVAFHVIQSGYTYANYLYSLSRLVWNEYNKNIDSPQMAIEETQKMLDYTDQSLEDLWPKTDDELSVYIIEARWKVRYDVEQLLEHAIVHILRHRRQIEGFLAQDSLVETV